MPRQPKPHWADAIKRDNVRLQDQIRELKMQPMLAEFAGRVAESIMIQLAMTPLNQWPDTARRAFDHEARKSPSIAQFYSNALPRP